MSRKSKKAEQRQADAAQPDTPAEVFGGVVEHTKGKDDVPVYITRSDPVFEAREKLAEKLWEQEKANYHVAHGENMGKPVTELEEAGEPEEEETVQAGESDAEEPAETEEKEGAEPEEGEADEGTGEEAEKPGQEEEYETLVVDGKELKKTKKDVYEAGRRALQKDLSADRRLEEATHLLRQAQATVQAQLPGEGAAQRGQLQPVPGKDLQVKIKDLFEKIRYGDDDEGQAALQELIQGRTATPDMGQILNGVGLFLEQDRIKNVFTKPPEDGGYADVYPEEMGGKNTDPEVWNYFDYKVNQLIMSGEPNALPTYRKAAEAVRERLGTTHTASANALAQKRERKREIDVVKGVKAKTPAAPKEKEETQADIIAWHRQNRR